MRGDVGALALMRFSLACMVTCALYASAVRAETHARRSIGICITGQISRLELDSKIRNLIKPFSKSGYDVDVVAVLSMSSKPVFMYNRFLPRTLTSWYENEEEVENYLRAHTRRTRVVAINQTLAPRLGGFYMKNLANQDAKKPEETRRQATIFVNQLRTQFECALNLLELEQRASAPYDYFVRIREDAGFLGPIDVAKLESEHNGQIMSCVCERWNGMNDKGIFAHRKGTGHQMERALSAPLLAHYLSAGGVPKRPANGYNPEKFMLHVLSNEGMAMQSTPLFCPMPTVIKGPEPSEWCFKIMDMRCWENTLDASMLAYVNETRC